MVYCVSFKTACESDLQLLTRRPMLHLIRPLSLSLWRPDPPGAVNSLAVEVFPSSIRLTWTAPLSNESIGFSGYNISYRVIGIGDCNASYTEPRTDVMIPDTSTSSYTIQNTTPWREYLITISAINFAGHGPESNTTVISQEIGKIIIKLIRLLIN